MRSVPRLMACAALLALSHGAAFSQVVGPQGEVVEPAPVVVVPVLPPTGTTDGTATGPLPDFSAAANAGGSAPQGGGGLDPNYIPGISPPGHSASTGTGASGASGFANSGN